MMFTRLVLPLRVRTAAAAATVLRGNSLPRMLVGTFASNHTPSITSSPPVERSSTAAMSELHSAQGNEQHNIVSQAPMPSDLPTIAEPRDIQAAFQVSLHNAVIEGSVSEVVHLLNQVVHMEAVDKDSLDLNVALCIAASMGHESIVQILLAAGACMKAVGRHRWTSLHQAAYKGHLSIVQILLAAGAKVDASDKNHATALHRAAQYGRASITQILLAAGANAKAKNKDRNTALHLAAQYGHTLIVQILLAAGANVQAVNKMRRTPLHLAVMKDHTSVVRVLVDAGANVKALDKDRKTPLQLVDRKGKIFAEKSLFAQEAMRKAENKRDLGTRLHWAAESGFRGEVRSVLAAGAPLEAVDEKHRTALHIAVENCRRPIVNALLAAGAKIEAVDCNQRTALHLSALTGRYHVVKGLLKAGANVHAVDKWACTPLHYAALMGHEHVLLTLLEAGANPFAKSLANKTPLDCVRRDKHPMIVVLLEAEMESST